VLQYSVQVTCALWAYQAAHIRVIGLSVSGAPFSLQAESMYQKLQQWLQSRHADDNNYNEITHI
jgi:hypothetical protein